MRALAYIAVAAVLGLATGLILGRILLGALVTAGMLVLGLFILISRSDPPRPEP